MNRYAFAAGAAALSLLLAACGSSGTTTTTTPAAPGASSTSADTAAAGGIVIKDFKYSGTMSVKAGEKVTVTNQDTAPHTVTSKTAGQFDSSKIDPGKSGTFTAPATAGTYPVICTIHPKMAATLTVTS